MLNYVRVMSFDDHAENDFASTVSACVAAYPRDNITLDGLIRAADESPYAAEAAGRDWMAVAVGEHEPEDQMTRRIAPTVPTAP